MHPQIEQEEIIREHNHKEEVRINQGAVGKRIPSYIRIFNVLGDGNWHKKSDFCRPYSEDRRRLNEMEQNGWIKYEEKTHRKNGQVIFSEYRIINIFPAWWEYYKKFNLIKPTTTGQIAFAI